MGYRRQPTVYRLVFQEYEGLEVMARSVSVEEMLTITGLASKMTVKPDDKQVGELFGWFAKRLVSWTLEDEDGKAVPATLKGLLDQEMGFVLKIVQAWIRAITGAPPPLSPPSGAGASPPDTPQTPRDPMESSIPMTVSPGN